MDLHVIIGLNCLLTIYAAEKHNKYYKVSMVASESDAVRPAVYGHGESPVWDIESQSLLFVDTSEQNVHRLDYRTGKIFTKHIEFGPAHTVMTILNSNRILVCVRASVFVMDWDVAGDASLRPFTSVDLGEPDNVINECKVDPKGRVWIGTKGPENEDGVTRKDRGTLYAVTAQNPAHAQVKIRPVTVTSGMVWGLNNSVFYFTDAATQKVEAFDFDAEKGTLCGRRTILDVTEYGYVESTPNGITIDGNGNLWVALMFGGTVLHINPDQRHVIYGYKMPVSRTTSVEWGGPFLDELFVTTSRVGVDETAEPLAGAVFTIRDTGSSGVQQFSFAMTDPDGY